MFSRVILFPVNPQVLQDENVLRNVSSGNPIVGHVEMYLHKPTRPSSDTLQPITHVLCHCPACYQARDHVSVNLVGAYPFIATASLELSHRVISLLSLSETMLNQANGEDTVHHAFVQIV